MKYFFFLLIFTQLLHSNSLEKNAKYLSNYEYKNLAQLNKFNGDVTEGVMSSYFKSSGWAQIEGEIGVNGIDGLFIKRNKSGKIKETLFVESKYNKSQLGHINVKDKSLKSRQMSKRALKKQVNKLIKDKKKQLQKILSQKEKKKLLKQLSDYKDIQKHINANNYRARLFNITPLGENNFKIKIDALEQSGYKNISKKTLTGAKKYKAHNKIINLKKKYSKGSYDYKLQQQLHNSIKNTKASHKIKKAYNNSKKTSKIFKKAIPAVFIKKGKKILSFMDAKSFKKVSQLKKLKVLRSIKGGDVVMLAIENGIAVYTVLNGGMTYNKVTKLLMSNARSLATEGFSKGIVFITPPPATLVAIATIAGAIAAEYAIDKYVELEKRNYVGLEDMLWDVPEEIKNKITILNLEDTKKETVFNFDDIDKETSLDDDVDGNSVFEENTNEEKTSLDY